MSVWISWLRTAIFAKSIQWLLEGKFISTPLAERILVDLGGCQNKVWWPFPVKEQAVLQVFSPFLQAPWIFSSVLYPHRLANDYTQAKSGPLPVFVKSFIGIQPRSFIYVGFVAAFALQWQRWVAAYGLQSQWCLLFSPLGKSMLIGH